MKDKLPIYKCDKCQVSFPCSDFAALSLTIMGKSLLCDKCNIKNKIKSNNPPK